MTTKCVRIDGFNEIVIYNDRVEYADMQVRGDVDHHLKLVAEALSGDIDGFEFLYSLLGSWEEYRCRGNIKYHPPVIRFVNTFIITSDSFIENAFNQWYIERHSLGECQVQQYNYPLPNDSSIDEFVEGMRRDMSDIDGLDTTLNDIRRYIQTVKRKHTQL